MDYLSEEIELSAGENLTFTIQMSPIVSNDDPASPAVSAPTAYPNPFRHSTELLWPQKNTHKLEIFNTRGQLIRSYEDPSLLATQSLIWDGRDHSGRAVSSGLYYCRISHSTGITGMRLVLIK